MNQNEKGLCYHSKGLFLFYHNLDKSKKPLAKGKRLSEL